MKNSTLVFYTQKEQETDIYTLPGNKQLGVYECYAFSAILSLGAFLTYKFPHLHVPGNKQLFETQYKQESFPDRFIETNPMFTNWVNYLVQQVVQGNALRKKETLYFKIQVTQEYTKVLEQNRFIKKSIPEKMTWQIISAQLNEQQLRQERKDINYLMIVCSKLNPLVDSYHSPALFMGLYYNNENWKVFRTLKNEFPSEEDFKQATQIIVPGSPLCISINIQPQVQRLINALRKIFKENSQMKYLGVCYGHQILSQTLTPGSVRRAKVGVHQNTTLHFIESQTRSKFDFLKNLDKVNVFETHNDQISRIPQNFTLLAKSQSCANQVMISNNGKILTFQGHPQYTSLRHRCLIAGLKYESQNITKQQMLQIMTPNANELPDQSPILQDIITKFLLSQ